MSRKIKFLKWLYLIGAVADGLSLMPMMIPSVRELVFGTSGPGFGPEYRYAISLAAALMAGWTVLLVWGFLKPVERRGLLLITVIPVIFGLMAANIYSVAIGTVAMKKMIPIWGLEIVISVLYIYGYRMAAKMAKDDNK